MAEHDDPIPTRCGTVALLGPPNTGKSTLVNALVGSKVSIVTPKAQTTRARITGILTEGAVQLIFLDTPGIFAPRRRLDRAMVRAAWSGAAAADILVVVVDSRRPAGAGNDDTARILDGLAQGARTAILVLNKIDLVPRQMLLERTRAITNAAGIFSDVFMISALKNDGVGALRAHLAAAAAEGPWLYPEDQIADAPLRFLAAEVTREKLFLVLHQELPYALTVETESWDDRPDGSVRIDQRILVTRVAHRPIVLGSGGSRIKSVGEAARLDLQEQFGRRVHLFLQVKVREHWSDEPNRYQEMGLEYPGAG